MSFDGPKPSSEEEGGRTRVESVERIVVSIVFGFVIALVFWLIVGMSVLVAERVPLWLVLVFWPLAAMALYLIDKETE